MPRFHKNPDVLDLFFNQTGKAGGLQASAAEDRHFLYGNARAFRGQR